MILRIGVCLVIAAFLYLGTARSAMADPTTTNCSQPEYRQHHLAECDQPHYPIPWGGSSRRGGLLGLGIGGIL